MRAEDGVERIACKCCYEYFRKHFSIRLKICTQARVLSPVFDTIENDCKAEGNHSGPRSKTKRREDCFAGIFGRMTR